MSLSKFYLAVLAVLSLSVQPCCAESFNVNNVKFMEGTWICDEDKDKVVQEYWSAPKGNSIAGICRFIKEDDETTFFELMTVREKKGGVYLTIKHFDGDFKPWPESEEAGDCRLVESKFDDAVFDNENKENHVRISYALKNDKLLSSVETEKGGKKEKFSFEYKREKLFFSNKLYELRKHPVGDFRRHDN